MKRRAKIAVEMALGTLAFVGAVGLLWLLWWFGWALGMEM